jgi:cell division protein FtsB
MARRQQMIWGAVMVALVLAVTSLTAEGGFRRYWRLRADMHTLEVRNAKLTDENARLRREVQALQDDPTAIDRAAREELGVIRPGELVFSLEAP